MPGYEPFLLCDFHVHTRWSDGALTVAEVIDLYGASGRFDVIAITDHILMQKDVLARAGRIATLVAAPLVSENRILRTTLRTSTRRLAVRSSSTAFS